MSSSQPGWCYACNRTVSVIEAPTGPQCSLCSSDFIELVDRAYAPAADSPLAAATATTATSATGDDEQAEEQEQAPGFMDTVLPSLFRSMAGDAPEGNDGAPVFLRGPAPNPRDTDPGPNPGRGSTLQFGPFQVGWQAFSGPILPPPNPRRHSSPSMQRERSEDELRADFREPQGGGNQGRNQHTAQQPERPERPRGVFDMLADLSANQTNGTFGPYTFVAPGPRDANGNRTDWADRAEGEAGARAMNPMRFLSMMLGGQGGEFVLPTDGGQLPDWFEMLAQQVGGEEGGAPAASDEAIESLPTFNMNDKQGYAHAKNTTECPICTDDFISSFDGAEGATTEAQNDDEDIEMPDVDSGAQPQTSGNEDGVGNGFHPDIPTNKLMLMPCGHLYHASCLVPWLEMHSTCPVCRSQLPDSMSARMRSRRRRNNNRGSQGARAQGTQGSSQGTNPAEEALNPLSLLRSLFGAPDTEGHEDHAHEPTPFSSLRSTASSPPPSGEIRTARDGNPVPPGGMPGDLGTDYERPGRPRTGSNTQTTNVESTRTQPPHGGAFSGLRPTASSPPPPSDPAIPTTSNAPVEMSGTNAEPPVPGAWTGDGMSWDTTFSQHIGELLGAPHNAPHRNRSDQPSWHEEGQDDLD